VARGGSRMTSDESRRDKLAGKGPWAENPRTPTVDGALSGHTFKSWKACSLFSSAVFAEHWS